MILNGQLQTSVNGVNIQNGLATQINAKVRCDSFSSYVYDVSKTILTFQRKMEETLQSLLMLIAVNAE
jgi:hypothetical protein